MLSAGQESQNEGGGRVCEGTVMMCDDEEVEVEENNQVASGVSFKNASGR